MGLLLGSHEIYPRPGTSRDEACLAPTRLEITHKLLPLASAWFASWIRPCMSVTRMPSAELSRMARYHRSVCCAR